MGASPGGNVAGMSIWPLDPSVSHLNHGSFGATPTPVLEAQKRLRDLMEKNPTRFMLERYQPALDAARQRVAHFVGADPAGFVFVNNATSGVNAVMRSLEPTLQSGDEILITNHGYNACNNVAAVGAARSGARVVTASFPFPIREARQVTEAIMDRVTPRTRLLLIDAVTSPTALVLPIQELVGALEPEVEVLVDAAHAPGMIHLDLSALGASYVVANCHKWMCSPKGAGFLYVREDRRPKIYPAVISHGYNDGWPSVGGHIQKQFDWTGTDDPTAWLTVPDALDVVGSLQPDGWEGVRRTNRDLCLAARDLLLAALEIDQPAPDAMIGSIASAPLPPAQGSHRGILDPLMVDLRDRWAIEVIAFSWPTPPGRLLRISAHQYNRIEEFERLAQALRAELARERRIG